LTGEEATNGLYLDLGGASFSDRDISESKSTLALPFAATFGLSEVAYG
jgi:hypothetical protein